MEDIIRTINLLNSASGNGKITSKVYNDKMKECIKDMETLSFYKQKTMEIGERNKFENYARTANRFDYEPGCEFEYAYKSDSEWYPAFDRKCPFDVKCPGFPPKCEEYTYFPFTTSPKSKGGYNFNIWTLLDDTSTFFHVLYKVIFIAMDKEKYEVGKYKETVLPLIKNVLSEKYNTVCVDLIISVLEKFSEEMFERIMDYLYKVSKENEFDIMVMKLSVSIHEALGKKDYEEVKGHVVSGIFMMLERYLKSREEKKSKVNQDINLDAFSGDDCDSDSECELDLNRTEENKPEVDTQETNNDTKKRKYE